MLCPKCEGDLYHHIDLIDDIKFFKCEACNQGFTEDEIVFGGMWWFVRDDQKIADLAMLGCD
jgi:hypothetical protein